MHDNEFKRRKHELQSIYLDGDVTHMSVLILNPPYTSVLRDGTVWYENNAERTRK